MHTNNLTLLPIDGFDTQKILSILDTMNNFVHEELTGLGMEFNVFDFTFEGQLGLYLGMFVNLGLITDSPALQLLFEFTIEISKNYPNNPYHSFSHAIDVSYMCYYMSIDLGLSEQLDFNSSDIAVLLLSAIGHDVLHPGTNNQFQIAMNTPSAIKYNKVSVLENQSADFLKVQLAKYSILQQLKLEANMTEEFESEILAKITDAILKTDMMYHFQILEECLNIIEYHNNQSKSISIPVGPTVLSPSTITPNSATSPNFKNILTLKKFARDTNSYNDSNTSLNQISKVILESNKSKNHMINTILHVADISNPIRPFDNSKRWADLVMKEFVHQGHLEKENNLPISPNMDDSIIEKQSTLQLSFIQFIVRPLCDCLYESFPKTLIFLDLLVSNSNQWGGTVVPIQSRRRGTDDLVKTSKHLQVGGKRPVETPNRRLSYCAGTIEIPESVGNYLNKMKKRHSRQKSSMSSNHSEYGDSAHSIHEDLEEESLTTVLETLSMGNLAVEN
ncbi:hypothetical protein BC833DRAFT_550752 [Globomyces pollinis-pini]|nr:hypothetical protein BC833DRAFT_550752 [Globomyces pollinis-pini]